VTIAFPKLGTQGRLGNQMFQYAFLRISARRLGTRFQCPAWIGDRIFCLDDAAERVDAPPVLDKTYRQPDENVGFEPGALRVEDGTEVSGYFQSERYFADEAAVRRWYRFREDAVAAAEVRFAHVDWSDSVGLHLRFGDKLRDPRFYQPRRRYYLDALSGRVPRRAHVLVFSDEPCRARLHLGAIGANAIFVEGNAAHEDLHLMSRCRDFIASSSTLSWWGAWLNPRADKTIVVPAEGHVRPGTPFEALDFFPPAWIRARGLAPIGTGYRTRRLAEAVMRAFGV
jgi:hypothetical protein